MTGKVFGRKRLWSNLRHHSDICLEGQRNIMKNTSHCSGQDLIRVLPECESKAWLPAEASSRGAKAYNAADVSTYMSENYLLQDSIKRWKLVDCAIIALLVSRGM
jgi:hypothetical protein